MNAGRGQIYLEVASPHDLSKARYDGNVIDGYSLLIRYLELGSILEH